MKVLWPLTPSKLALLFQLFTVKVSWPAPPVKLTFWIFVSVRDCAPKGAFAELVRVSVPFAAGGALVPVSVKLGSSVAKSVLLLPPGR